MEIENKIMPDIFDQVVIENELKGSSVEACRLYYVEGIRSKSTCAKRSGISIATAKEAIQKFERLFLNRFPKTGPERVVKCYIVPPSKEEELDNYVKSLIYDYLNSKSLSK